MAVKRQPASVGLGFVPLINCSLEVSKLTLFQAEL